MAEAALRLPDVHDDEPHGDPSDPCPVCLGRVEDGICYLCGVELCEECGKVEVTGATACCNACAPVYRVHVGSVQMHETRSLRRAWEAQRYYDEAFGYHGASLLNPNKADMGHDGITEREQRLLESWDSWHDTDIGRRCAPVHLCVMREGLVCLNG